MFIKGSFYHEMSFRAEKSKKIVLAVKMSVLLTDILTWHKPCQSNESQIIGSISANH
jgi:hypothetical protein